MEFKCLFILILFKLKTLVSFPDTFLQNPSLYANELCSYNGKPSYNSTSKEVTCKCKDKFADEPRKDKIQKINEHIIHCSYERKSRFMAVFLCLCLPFGIDFFYLKRYSIFTLVFSLCIIHLSCNIILFYVDYRINLLKKETIILKKKAKIMNKTEIPIIEAHSKSRKFLNYCTKLFMLNQFIYTFIVLILHIIGFICDGNDVKTENDLGYIFSTPDPD